MENTNISQANPNLKRNNSDDQSVGSRNSDKSEDQNQHGQSEFISPINERRALSESSNRSIDFIDVPIKGFNITGENIEGDLLVDENCEFVDRRDNKRRIEGNNASNDRRYKNHSDNDWRMSTDGDENSTAPAMRSAD